MLIYFLYLPHAKIHEQVLIKDIAMTSSNKYRTLHITC